MIEWALNPNFEEFVKDGELNVLRALESHLSQSSIILHSAKALLAIEEPNPEDALEMLGAYEQALAAGMKEAYRVSGVGKAA